MSPAGVVLVACALHAARAWSPRHDLAPHKWFVLPTRDANATRFNFTAAQWAQADRCCYNAVAEPGGAKREPQDGVFANNDIFHAACCVGALADGVKLRMPCAYAAYTATPTTDYLRVPTAAAHDDVRVPTGSVEDPFACCDDDAYCACMRGYLGACARDDCPALTGVACDAPCNYTSHSNFFRGPWVFALTLALTVALPCTLCCGMPTGLHALPTLLLELRVQRGEAGISTPDPRDDGLPTGLLARDVATISRDVFRNTDRVMIDNARSGEPCTFTCQGECSPYGARTGCERLGCEECRRSDILCAHAVGLLTFFFYFFGCAGSLMYTFVHGHDRQWCNEEWARLDDDPNFGGWEVEDRDDLG